MTVTIRAHFDGKVLVPDELVTLPVNQPLELTLSVPRGPHEEPDEPIAERLARLAAAAGRLTGPVLIDDDLRRENLYEERS